jgi:hypothetical protein
MIALLICIIGFLGAYRAGRHSLGAGCVVVLISGYTYGILRANLLTPFSHFSFDASLGGLYLSQFFSRPKFAAVRTDDRTLRLWCIALVGWPVLLLFTPFQTFLVSLVGLRGNMFMLPLLLLGTRLTSRDLNLLAISLAVMNILALGVGVAEYVVGIEPFFPLSAVTTTIYGSMDAAGHNRIPSTFSNAHGYAGTILDTVPFIFGAWALKSVSKKKNALLLLGLASALLGTLMASTRLCIMEGGLIALVATLSGNLSRQKRVFWLVGIGVLIVSALSNERWQRFKSLGESDVLTDRIAGSVNRGFFEILTEYPMGNGLGGGGTSIPYFLASQVKLPIAVESTYACILLEQGIVGLGIWTGFLLWFLANRCPFTDHPWLSGRKLAWWTCLFVLATGFIGNGVLASIPGTFLLLLAMGWVAVEPQPMLEGAADRPRRLAPFPVAAQVPA